MGSVRQRLDRGRTLAALSTRVLLAAVAAAALATPGRAQVVRSTFPVTLGSGSVKGLPFDEPFQVTMTATEDLRQVRLWVGPEKDFPRESCARLRPRATPNSGGGEGRTNVALAKDIAAAKPRIDSVQRLLDEAVASRTRISLRVDSVSAALAQQDAQEKEYSELVDYHTEQYAELRERGAPVEALESHSREIKRAQDSLGAVRDRLERSRTALAKALGALDQADVTVLDLKTTLKTVTVVPSDPTSVWWRAGLDSSLTVALDVGKLEPNTDYTFCYQLVQNPSADDLAKFKAEANKALTTTVRTMAGRALEGVSAIDAIQVALLSAIPQLDSIEVNASSVLSRPSRPEDVAERSKRLNRLVQFYAVYRTAFEDRANGARNAESSAQRVDTALRRLVGHSASLRRLAALARDSRAIQNRVLVFGTASAVARRLAIGGALEDAYFSDVARGVKPLDDMSAVHPGRDLSKTWSSDQVRGYDATLARTSALVDSVRDLAAFALSEPSLIERFATAGRSSAAATRAFTADIGDVVQHATELLSSIADERANLANVIVAIESANGAVDGLVASITAIDFAYVSLRGSTAVTNQARALSYVSLDAGLVGGHRVRSVIPYFGVNLYFRPVNKNMHLPLPFIRRRPLYLSRRFALTLGVTAASVKEDDRVDDLFSSHSVLIGGGFRLTDYWRVTAGGLVLKSFPDGKEGPGKVTVVHAFGTSIDLDILGSIGKIPGLLIPNFK